MRSAPISALLLFTVCGLSASAQKKEASQPATQRDVFVVNADSAIGDPLLGFKPTRVELTDQPMDLTGKRELVRMLLMEQGFAHRALPLGAPGLVLHANGRLTVDSETLKQRMYKDGMSAGAGDRIMITDINVLVDRINVDVNGGPYLPHRFLRHLQVNGIQMAGDGQVGESPTGTRITLLFEGPTPRLTGSEVKALLEPLLDFGLKSGEQAYADTLPPPIKKAIDEHEILVGMNRRMVLAALGQPESKLRERAPDSTTGEVFEEWIYGHTPQTIRFVRFRGDRVVLMKLAALGKPLQIYDQDQLASYRDPSLVHEVALGDTAARKKGEDPDATHGPSLLGSDEKIDVDGIVKPSPAKPDATKPVTPKQDSPKPDAANNLAGNTPAPAQPTAVANRVN
jgi:hypothetical protein